MKKDLPTHSLPRCTPGVAALLMLMLSTGAAPAWAQQGIYTCIDEQGRHLTSDRPIPACKDRPQRQLSPSGTEVRVIQPAMSAIEREKQAAREREAEVRRQRALNAIRRDQALFTRYPTRDAHELGRKSALAVTDGVVETAEQRIAELQQQRKKLDQELEFYKKDPSKVPPKLRFDLESNEESIADQHQAIAGQQAERDRIHAQFDEEAARLAPMWQAAEANAAAAAATEDGTND